MRGTPSVSVTVETMRSLTVAVSLRDRRSAASPAGSAYVISMISCCTPSAGRSTRIFGGADVRSMTVSVSGTQ